MLGQSLYFPEKRILKFLFNPRRENHRKSQEEHIQKIFDIVRRHLTNIKKWSWIISQYPEIETMFGNYVKNVLILILVLTMPGPHEGTRISSSFKKQMTTKVKGIVDKAVLEITEYRENVSLLHPKEQWVLTYLENSFKNKKKGSRLGYLLTKNITDERVKRKIRQRFFPPLPFVKKYSIEDQMRIKKEFEMNWDLFTEATTLRDFQAAARKQLIVEKQMKHHELQMKHHQQRMKYHEQQMMSLRRDVKELSNNEMKRSEDLSNQQHSYWLDEHRQNITKEIKKWYRQLPYYQHKKAVMIQSYYRRYYYHSKYREQLQFECPVCFLGLSKRNHERTICGHWICRNCIEEWVRVKKKNTCPLCRTLIA